MTAVMKQVNDRIDKLQQDLEANNPDYRRLLALYELRDALRDHFQQVVDELKQPLQKRDKPEPKVKYASLKGVLLVSRDQLRSSVRGWLSARGPQPMSAIASHVAKVYPHYFRQGSDGTQVYRTIRNTIGTSKRGFKLSKDNGCWRATGRTVAANKAKKKA